MKVKYPSPSDDKITTQLSAALNKNAMYVHGYSKLGMPIVWLRTDRKPWFVKDVQSEILAYVAIADIAIKCMPEGVNR